MTGRISEVKSISLVSKGAKGRDPAKSERKARKRAGQKDMTSLVSWGRKRVLGLGTVSG